MQKLLYYDVLTALTTSVLRHQRHRHRTLPLPVLERELFLCFLQKVMLLPVPV